MANVWKIAPGEHAEDWPVFRDRGCIGLGWLTDDDYRHFRTEADVLQALEQRHGKGTKGNGRRAAQMIWRFAHEIRRSDVVVANEGYNGVVGVGVVQGDYLPPTSPDNPMLGDQTTHRHHARKVRWVINKAVKLGRPYFFVQSTLWPLGAEQVDQIRQAYLEAYPAEQQIRAVLGRLFGTDSGSGDVVNEALAAAERQLVNEDAFNPADIEDARERVLASIVRRRGQSSFRSLLLATYDGQCAVSGCAVEAVLEAAHIIPYRGEETNHVGNGLLLRADWHTLFDLGLVAVDPATMRLLVSPGLAGTEYHEAHGKPLMLPDDSASRPSAEALKQHLERSGLGA